MNIFSKKIPLSIVLVLSIDSAMATENIRLEAETVSHVIEGQSARFYEVRDENIKQAILFYRMSGTSRFLRQLLIQENDVWYAEFSGQQLRSPGVDFYIKLIYKNAEVKTDPAQYPTYNPKQLLVKPKPEISISIAKNSESQILFKVSGYVDAETQVYLGDIDITNMLLRNGSEWTLNKKAGIFNGKQSIKIKDKQGSILAIQEISSKDKTSTISKYGELVLRGNANFSLGGQKSSDNETQSSTAATANLHLETEYNKGDFSSKFSGVNINYTYDAEDEFNLSSGFLLSNSYKDSTLQIGDVSVKGTPLVLSGFSRRGMVLQSKGKNWAGSLFNLRTSTVEGWESGLSVDNRQTYGASYEQKVGADGKTKVQLTVLSGKLQDPQSSNVGSAESSAQSGDSVGVSFDTQLAGTKINSQIATSSFDVNSTDAVEAETDKAYELSFSRDLFGLASAMGYQHYGANYATIANPNFSGDRVGYNFSFGSNWRFLQWSTSFSSTEDNVDRDPLRAVVTSENTGLTLGFIIKNWPSINIGLNLNAQNSIQDVAIQGVDNTGQDVSLSLADNVGPFNLSWSSSLGELEDKLAASAISETSNHSFSVAYVKNKINLSINASQNVNQSINELTSNLLSLSLNIPLVSDKIILSSQFSFQTNESDDNSQSNKISGGSARISWTLADILGVSKSSIWGSAQFGLNWTYNKNTDDIDASLDKQDSKVLLDFSFGAPIKFENKWKM